MRVVPSDDETRRWSIREQQKACSREALWREAACWPSNLLAAIAVGEIPASDRWQQVATEAVRLLGVAHKAEHADPFTRLVHPDDLDSVDPSQGVLL